MKFKRRRIVRDTTLMCSGNEGEGEGREHDKQQRKQKQKDNGITIFDNLPFFIIIDILSRLPINTLAHCRRVCKTWYSLLSDPYFSEVHLARGPTTILLSTSSSVHLLEIGSGQDNTQHPMRLMRLNTEFIPPDARLELVSSCNGLLCLLDRHYQGRIYIWNPMLGEFFSIPKPKRKKEDFPTSSYDFHTAAYGFGSSPTTGHNKIIRISCDRVFDHNKSRCEVVTVGTNKWRNVGNVIFPLYEKICSFTFNGALHWMCLGLKNAKAIYSFDITEEQIRPIPVPLELANNNIWKNLGVLQDHLCLLVQYFALEEIHIWSMKEYGVAESWTKDHILRTPLPLCLSSSLLRPLQIWKDGDILMSSPSHPLFSYDPKGGKYTQFRVYDLIMFSCDRPLPPLHVAAITYVPSFLSIKGCPSWMRSVKFKSK